MRVSNVPAPATIVYAGVLTATGLWATRLPWHVHDAVLRQASTNLRNLERRRVHTLFTSAAFLPPPRLPCFIANVPVIAAGELAMGSRRAIAAFAVGHLGASVLVGAVLKARALPGADDAAVRHAVDVGPSYGAIAVGSAMTGLLTRAGGPPWIAVPVATTLAGMVVSPTFTEVGHFCSSLLGAALGTAWRAADRRRGGSHDGPSPGR